jgi:hypothetical protein
MRPRILCLVPAGRQRQGIEDERETAFRMAPAACPGARQVMSYAAPKTTLSVSRTGTNKTIPPGGYVVMNEEQSQPPVLA